MTSGEQAVSWSLSDFDDMTDKEILGWYETYCKTMTERTEALERALASMKRG